jgi:excisionase family DNA binding protein
MKKEPNMETSLLKGPEVAKYLNCSRSQAFNLMRTGQIPTVRFGKLVRVRQEDIESFIKKNLVEDQNDNKQN